jgi:hypothetical protein
LGALPPRPRWTMRKYPKFVWEKKNMNNEYRCRVMNNVKQ